MMKKNKFLSFLFLLFSFSFFPLFPREKTFLSPLASSFPSPTPTASLTLVRPEEKEINLLLLGLDGRKSQKKDRCDAIHLLSLNREKEKMTILSFSRGTLVKKENGEETYLANLCQEGVESLFPYLEKISGKKIHFTVKLGFSQALGLFRMFGLPSTSTLAFLRARNYPTGDHQRSYNQALFLKDLLTTKLPLVINFPSSLKKLAFKRLETNLDFFSAEALLREIYQRKIPFFPEKIEIIALPKVSSSSLQEIHWQDWLEKEARQNKEEEKEKIFQAEFAGYQKELEDFFRQILSQGETLLEKNQKEALQKLLTPAFIRQVWLQIEDYQKRNEFHFALLRLYVLSLKEKEKAKKFVFDFLWEMETLGEKSLKQEGEKLLKTLE